MGENGLRVPSVFVYNADMRKKGINMSRVSLWAAVCLLSTFSIQAETVAPEGCGLSGRIGELPHLYAPPMLGNGDVTCAFEPDGGMSTNNFSRLVPGIYRAGRRRPLPDCGLFCFGRVKSVWAIDGKDVVDGIWKQTLDTRRAVLENRRASRDVHERMTAFVPMGRACVMVRKTVRNVGTETRRVRFGIGYEIPDDPFVVGGWLEENAGTRAYAARWIGHRLTAGRVTVLPFDGAFVAETTLEPGESATRTWAIVLEDALDADTGSVADVRNAGWEGLFSAVRPVPGSTRLIPGEETDDLTVCTERKGSIILIDPPRAGLPGSGDPRA